MGEDNTSFNQLLWHDSKLISFELLPKGDRRYDIAFDLKLLTNPKPGNYDWRTAKLEIQQCTIVQMELDLLGIQLCDGDIATAICELASETDLQGAQIQTFISPEGDNMPHQLLKFSIVLVPPGGEIMIIAERFNLRVEEPV